MCALQFGGAGYNLLCLSCGKYDKDRRFVSCDLFLGIYISIDKDEILFGDNLIDQKIWNNYISLTKLRKAAYNIL